MSHPKVPKKLYKKLSPKKPNHFKKLPIKAAYNTPRKHRVDQKAVTKAERN
jgi:hypothetical protein